MTKSKSNSVKVGKYTFQPTRYDADNNLYCSLYRLNSHEKKVCKLTGIYKFDEDVFEIIYIEEGWLLTNKHKKLLDFMLNEYDWKL